MNPVTLIPSLSAHQISSKTIWAIGGGKGGTGKSFITANLALHLASKEDDIVLIDADFGEIEDPVRLNDEINATIGVVEHGIFLNVDEVHIGTVGGVNILKK